MRFDTTKWPSVELLNELPTTPPLDDEWHSIQCPLNVSGATVVANN